MEGVFSRSSIKLSRILRKGRARFPASPSLGCGQDPPLHLPATSPLPPPSGGRDASAVESCSWLGHHWLMPGTRSSEYAHLAGRPGNSDPDMERQGGQVCVPAREAGRKSRSRLRPELASPVPTSSHLPSGPSSTPPPFAQPSSAGSQGKLLIALHQPRTGVIGRGASQRAIKGVMQRTRSHSRTQRGGHCTALSQRRRRSEPASPRAGSVFPVLTRRPRRQATRPRPDTPCPPDPGRPDWRPEVSAWKPSE